MEALATRPKRSTVPLVAMIVLGTALGIMVVWAMTRPTSPTGPHMGSSMMSGQPWTSMHGDMGAWMAEHPGWIDQNWSDMGSWMREHPQWMRDHWGAMGSWMADHPQWMQQHWDQMGSWLQSHPTWMRNHWGDMGPWMPDPAR